MVTGNAYSKYSTRLLNIHFYVKTTNNKLVVDAIYFFCKKSEKGRKSKKIEAKFSKKMWVFHPNAGQGFYSQKKTRF